MYCIILYSSLLDTTHLPDIYNCYHFFFFFSSRRRHTRFDCDWSSDVCSSDLSSMLSSRANVEPKDLVSSSATPSVVKRSPEIGRASCRKECRSRWSPYH